MSEAARPAEAEDLPRLAELTRDAAAELTSLRGGRLLVGPAAGAGTDRVRELLLPYLEDADRLLLVGTIDGVVLGLAAVRTDADRARVDVLYVEPPARAVGVGAALMEAVTDWCRQRGCTGIDAPALPGSRHAKQFFEASGLTARLLVMHREL